MHSPTPTDVSLYENVDSLFQAASMGFDDELPKFIAQGTHLKDERGSVLYIALTKGHVECVRLLKNASVPVLNKHYYAAGLAGAANAATLYDIIRPGQATRPQGPVADIQDLLFHSARQGNLLMVRAFVEHHTPIEARHFYAAGKYFDKTRPETQTTCKRMFDLLKAFSENKPLPNDFYTPEEQAIYAKVEQEANASTKPTMV